MEDKSKDNILNGVNQKLKRKGLRIAVISVISCIVIGVIAYLLLFVKTTPISVELFKDVKIERKFETLNQLDDRELPYNHLTFTIEKNIFYSFPNAQYYVINDDTTNTATLYFYIGENYIEKHRAKNKEPIYTNILVSSYLCKTDKVNEITKVYYLPFDYKNFKQEKFDKIKNEAVLLWEK